MIDLGPKYCKEIKDIIDLLLRNYPNVYLIGGEAREFYFNRELGTRKDIDILVCEKKPHIFNVLFKYLKYSSENLFGGLKININGQSMDVVCLPLLKYLLQVPLPKQGIAVNFETEEIFKTEEFKKDPNSEEPITDRKTTAKVGSS